MKLRKSTVGEAVQPTDDPMVIDIIGSSETPDRDGDVIRVRGWQLESFAKNPVFMWAHDYTQLPLGKAVHVIRDQNLKQLIFRIKFDADSPNGPTVAKLFKNKTLNASSVGFIPTKAPVPREKGLHIHMGGMEFDGQELLELSAVPIPSNPDAIQLALSKGWATEKELERIGFKEGTFVPPSIDERIERLELLIKSISVDSRAKALLLELGEEDSPSSSEDDVDDAVLSSILEVRQQAAELSKNCAASELKSIAALFRK